MCNTDPMKVPTASRVTDNVTYMTLWRQTRDATIFKVVTGGN